MADAEQLKILKQGVEIWNTWRAKHPETTIDLSGADLIGMAFSGVNFHGANLENAFLHKADLSEANLCTANLSRAALRGANLHKTDLRGVDLRKASLSKAIIDDTTQIECKWKLAWELVNKKSRQCHELSNTDLSWTDLSGAALSGADLSGANLTEANLWKAELDGADLTGAVLEKANLQCANFRGADLRYTNLCHANFTEANLMVVDLSGALLTGAKLYGAAHDDWTITDVECEYIFWDQEHERIPLDRNFRPGEFEELYAQLPEISYYFVQSFTIVDAVVMSKVVETINQQNPEYDLKLDSFHSRGQPHAKFTILHKKDAEQVLKFITERYEERIAALEGKQEQMMQLMSMMVNNPQKIEVILGNKQITTGNDYFENIAGDNFDSSGGNMNIAKDQGCASQSND